MLLYRGSRDGFTQDSFMAKMQDVPSQFNCTLILIRTMPREGKKYVFGGFTDIPWRYMGGSDGLQQTNKSFIFSMRPDGSFEKLSSRKNQDEVYHSLGTIVNFANTIIVYSDCNTEFNYASLKE